MLRLPVHRRRATAILCFVLGFSVIYSISLACSQAKANIWLVTQFTKSQQIRALAVDHSNLSLIASCEDSLKRFYPDGLAGSILGLHPPTQIAVFPQGDLIDLDDGSITYFGGDPLKHQLITGVYGLHPVIVDAKHRVPLSAESLALNRAGELFIGGYKREEKYDKNMKYYVWQYSQDSLGQWHATTLASGSISPRLISTNSQAVRLLDNGAGSFELLPVAKGKLELQPFSAHRPPGVKKKFKDNITPARIAQGYDGATVLSDGENNRIWRLSPDGKNLDLIAGMSGARDDYQTDPLQFKFFPGAIAVARTGGIFVEDGDEAIRFIGPNDQLEKYLAESVMSAESLARDGKTEQAHQRVVALKQLATAEAKTMRGWRAKMALTTLRFRLTPAGFAKVENWSSGPALASEPAAGKKSKKKCSCFG